MATQERVHPFQVPDLYNEIIEKLEKASIPFTTHASGMVEDGYVCFSSISVGAKRRELRALLGEESHPNTKPWDTYERRIPVNHQSLSNFLEPFPDRINLTFDNGTLLEGVSITYSYELTGDTI